MKNLFTYIILLMLAAGCNNRTIEGCWMEEGVVDGVFYFNEKTYDCYFMDIGWLDSTPYYIADDSLKIEGDSSWKVTWVDENSFKLERGEVVSHLNRISKTEADRIIYSWENSKTSELLDFIEIKEVKSE